MDNSNDPENVRDLSFTQVECKDLTYDGIFHNSCWFRFCLHFYGCRTYDAWIPFFKNRLSVPYFMKQMMELVPAAAAYSEVMC